MLNILKYKLSKKIKNDKVVDHVYDSLDLANHPERLKSYLYAINLQSFCGKRGC